MPTTKLKNALYRLMLPVFAPSCGKHPISRVTGHTLVRRQAFVRLLHCHHVLGSATLLAHEDRHQLILTGSVSPEHRAEDDTFFRVASITKTATAVLAMRFADQGMLSLDHPVNCYFRCPDVKNSLDGITLRHLLSHTSGIIDPPGLESALESDRPFTDFLPSVRVCAPGSSFHYSNLGFGLIGCVFESVLNQPLGSIFNQFLFNPLGMNASLEGCLLPENKIMPVTRILPYHKGHDLILTKLGSAPLSSPDPLRHYGHTAGSMYTDISSLLTLLRVLVSNDGSFLSCNAVSEMKKEHASYNKLSPTLSYGLGLLRINDSSVSDGTVYGHQGFAYGCADGAFWEEDTGNIMITLNGGCSEARTGRLGIANRDFLRWAFRKEFPSW